MIDLRLGDCLKVMPTLKAGSIDAIITDLPYGITRSIVDVVIPFEPMWEQIGRVLKPHGAFVTTAVQPFAGMLIMSNLSWFRYEWIWDKVVPSGMQLARYRPMRRHENVLVFGSKSPRYFPIKTSREGLKISGRLTKSSESNPLGHLDNKRRVYVDRFPTSIITEYSRPNSMGKDHPTQKPVALYEYLIRTYTEEEDTILDFCAGSGTTGVSAMETNRNCILIEKSPKYFEIARLRMVKAKREMRYRDLKIECSKRELR